MNGKKILGIIGGMGPAATTDLYKKIIDQTPAKKDQDHLHVIIDSDSEIPDRTEYILSVCEGGDVQSKVNKECINAENPLPDLIQSAQRLESAGVDFVVMACITAHIFSTEIADSIKNPFFAIPDIATKALMKKDVKKVVVLSTKGTAQAHIFDETLANNNIEFIYAAQEYGELMMELIYSLVKGGNPQLVDELGIAASNMLSHYRHVGYNNFLLACTELPIAFKMLGLIDESYTDCTEELAKFCVKYALGTNK